MSSDQSDGKGDPVSTSTDNSHHPQYMDPDVQIVMEVLKEHRQRGLHTCDACLAMDIARALRNGTP